jgi:ABC-type sugar transport system permease subunit
MTESSYNRVPVVRRQLRDFVVGATVAILIASAAFVGVRNRELEARQLDLATRSAEAISRGQAALPMVQAEIVSEPRVSTKHPYLRRREIRGRALGSGPDDKLFYDAANRFQRVGAFAVILPDGSGRAIAARPASSGVAIAITAPGEPASYPVLVVIGVLGLGGAIAAAGALVGHRAQRMGILAGIATLAVPTLLWGSWLAAALIVAIAGALAIAQRAGATDRFAAGLARHRAALGFLSPAGIAMAVLVGAPFVIGLALGFYDHHQGTYTFVGLSNFIELLSGGGHSLDDPLNFWFILGSTVLWTAANVVLHVTIGVALALVLSRTWLRGKGILRMLLILPWAVPNYITALMWRGMFEGEHSAVNSILHAFGLADVSWFARWATSFSANVSTNTWLGVPFMMVVALGALETIPKELYEAAAVDGASAWQRFRHITLPHLRPALGPAVVLGSIWTFNMFNVIYLVSGGKPGGKTDILVTDAYRWAFERGDRYGMAAAEGTLIFLILLLWTVFGTRVVRGKEPA